MTRVVIFFNRGYLPTHMNYHDMITFRLRYTCVYFKSAPIRSVYRYGFFLNPVSLISEGYKNIALASYSPMWQYHRRVAMKALRLVYTERLVTNFFFFFCLLTVWPPLCYMYIMFRSGQKVWRQKVRQRRDTNILSSYCLTIGIL